MDRPIIVIFVMHIIVALFGLTGCVLAALNFGRPLPFPKNGDPISKPQLPDDFNITNEFHAIDISLEWKKYNELVNARASFNQDPRSEVMVPFSGTTALAAAMAAASILIKDAYSTTTIFYCQLSIWMIHFCYLIDFQFARYPYIYTVHKLLIPNYKAGVPAVLTLHCIMLALLTVTMVLCGRYMVSRNGSLVCCNIRSFFSIATFLTIVRTLLGIIAFSVVPKQYGKGLYPDYDNSSKYCDLNDDCARYGVPDTLFFFIGFVLCINAALAVENFLSAFVGKKNHPQLEVASGITSGVLTFVGGTMMTPIWVLKYKGRFQTDYPAVFMISCFCFVQSFMLWYCPKFLHAIPSLYRLLSCWGVEPGTNEQRPHNTSGTITTITTTTTTTTTTTVEPKKNFATEFVKRNILLLNTLFVFIGVMSLVMMTVVDKTSSTVLFTDLVLMAVLSSMTIKSAVTILIIFSTESAPQETDVQLVVQLCLDCLLLFSVSVATFATTHSIYRQSSASLSLFVMILKSFHMGGIVADLAVSISRGSIEFNGALVDDVEPVATSSDMPSVTVSSEVASNSTVAVTEPSAIRREALDASEIHFSKCDQQINSACRDSV